MASPRAFDSALPLAAYPPATSVDPLAVDAKEARLLADLRALGRCLVAFSGGVDSTYLAWAAMQALGDEAVAMTAISPSLPRAQRREARLLAEQIGIRHQVISTAETADPRYRANNTDRCYWCKRELYTELGAIAAAAGGVAVLDGTNVDDLGDVRPGRQAARELGVVSPLVGAGLTKGEIRELSRRAGLPTWDRPASPCLSSRIPYGSGVDETKLAAIDAAEEAVRELGFREFRVRHHGPIARIEIAAAELPRALAGETPARLAAGVRAAGFQFATIDLEPFRSGRLNEAAGVVRPLPRAIGPA